MYIYIYMQFFPTLFHIPYANEHFITALFPFRALDLNDARELERRSQLRTAQQAKMHMQA